MRTLLTEESHRLRDIFQTMRAIDQHALYLTLTGTSVVDWCNLPLANPLEAEEILRVNAFKLGEEQDVAYMQKLISRAKNYLENLYEQTLPPAIHNVDNIMTLFALAAEWETCEKSIARTAGQALKVVHILHNLFARELLYHVPLAEDQLLNAVFDKISKIVDGFHDTYGSLVFFRSDEKKTDSMISKMLVTEATQASQIFDRFRCRLVVKTLEDVVQVMQALLQNVIPFNYIIPGRSKNTLIPLSPLLECLDEYASKQLRISEITTSRLEKFNDCSGPSYGAVKFVTEVPLRVENIIREPLDKNIQTLGPIILAQTELQIVDEKTFQENERGDNSHQAYKKRQRKRVQNRIGKSTEE